MRRSGEEWRWAFQAKGQPERRQGALKPCGAPGVWLFRHMMYGGEGGWRVSKTASRLLCTIADAARIAPPLMHPTHKARVLFAPKSESDHGMTMFKNLLVSPHCLQNTVPGNLSPPPPSSYNHQTSNFFFGFCLMHRRPT